ncbi:hypothetical protein KR222_004610, partial [Zaprionus bogoriensis]
LALICAAQSVCYFPRHFHPNSTEMCQYVRTHPFCSYQVYYLDYLNLLFCKLDMPWDDSYIFVVLLYLCVLYFVQCMIVKYFCLPNYMMLMELLPITPYMYSYVYFGLCLFVPAYMGIWLSCTYMTEFAATVELSKAIGDSMRYMTLSITLLSLYRYHVKGVRLWGNTLFIFLGYVYMLYVVNAKYTLYGRQDLPYDDSHLLTTTAWTILLIFVLVLAIQVSVSYHSLRRHVKRKNREDATRFQDLDSDVEVITTNVKRTDLSIVRVWWNTVNAFEHMRERHKILVIAFSPLFFLLANIIPVIDKERPMRGWCKPIACISLLIFPVVFIGLLPDPFTWSTVAVVCFFSSFVVLLSTNSLCEPNSTWLRIYSLLGMTMCSVSMYGLHEETDNIIWQYFSMRLRPSGDIIQLMMYSTGHLFCEMVLVNNLFRRNLPDAAYGATMSTITYTIYMCLPMLALHQCYHSSTFIQITANAKTTATFFVAILFGTMFHISMCGNEYRMSLSIYLAILYASYILFQLASFQELVHPFGSLHKIQAPL